MTHPCTLVAPRQCHLILDFTVKACEFSFLSYSVIDFRMLLKGKLIFPQTSCTQYQVSLTLLFTVCPYISVFSGLMKR